MFERIVIFAIITCGCYGLYQGTGLHFDSPLDEGEPSVTSTVAPSRGPAHGAAVAGEPDRATTPGTVFQVCGERGIETDCVTQQRICSAGYTARVRNVPEEERRQVFVDYGIPYNQSHSYEVDHLVSLELGGDNSINNLWPEPHAGVWNSFVKDHLENRLHDLVCSGRVPLHQAQYEIATDWIGAYKRYVSPEPQGEDGHEEW